MLEETEIEVDLPSERVLVGNKGKGKAGAPDSDDDSAESLPHRTKGREMRVWTRNLDHVNILAVTEGMRVTEELALDPKAVALDKNNRLSTSEEERERPKRSNYFSFGRSDSPDPTAQGASTGNTIPTAHRLRHLFPLHLYTSLPLTASYHAGHCESSYGFSILQRRIERFGLKRFRAHTDTSRAGLLWAVEMGERLRTGDQEAVEEIERLGRAIVAKGTWAPELEVEESGAGAISGSMPSEDPFSNSVASAGEGGIAADRKPRLGAALRPPFLDGYPPSPLQRVRNWWKGEKGVVQQAREAGELIFRITRALNSIIDVSCTLCLSTEERMRWAHKARETFNMKLPSSASRSDATPASAQRDAQAKAARKAREAEERRRRMAEMVDGDDIRERRQGGM